VWFVGGLSDEFRPRVVVLLDIHVVVPYRINAASSRCKAFINRRAGSGRGTGRARQPALIFSLLHLPNLPQRFRGASSRATLVIVYPAHRTSLRWLITYNLDDCGASRACLCCMECASGLIIIGGGRLWMVDVPRQLTCEWAGC